MNNTLVTDLKSQVTSLAACVEDIRKASETNQTSAETLSRVIDVAREDLHNTAQHVNDSTEELTEIPSQIRDAIANINAHQPTPHTPYRDAVLTEAAKSPPTRAAPRTSPLCTDRTRANAAIKERQILLDIEPGHKIFNDDTPRGEMAHSLQKALTNMQGPKGPSLQVKALTRIRNGGYVVEMATAEAATWVRDPIRKLILTESLGGNIQVKDRTYSLLIPFVPIATRIDDQAILRNIERTNNIPTNSIVQMKWIKDPRRHERNQRVAHALMSLNIPQAANKLIEHGLYLDHGRLHPRKDKREPIRCLKCQRWGHMAKACPEEKDTCGTCGGEHRHSNCNSYRTFFCVNCRTNEHSSSNKECPEYISQRDALNVRTPENLMPYSPTEEPWTQVSLPPKSSEPIIHSQPPPPSTPRNRSPAPMEQRTINWMME